MPAAVPLVVGVEAGTTPQCVTRGRTSSSASPILSPLILLLRAALTFRSIRHPRPYTTLLHSNSAIPLHPRKRLSLLPTGVPSQIHRGSRLS